MFRTSETGHTAPASLRVDAAPIDLAGNAQADLRSVPGAWLYSVWCGMKHPFTTSHPGSPPGGAGVWYEGPIPDKHDARRMHHLCLTYAACPGPGLTYPACPRHGFTHAACSHPGLMHAACCHPGMKYAACPRPALTHTACPRPELWLPGGTGPHPGPAAAPAADSIAQFADRCKSFSALG